MGIFDKIFGKKSSDEVNSEVKQENVKNHKGFHELTIQKIEKLTKDTVKVIFDIPEDLKSTFQFEAGQYVNFIILINGKEERRSYSICSGPNEQLAVAVKKIENGTVSTWFNENAIEGLKVHTSKPEGNFVLDKTCQKIITFAAGSGVTPIVSILKTAEINNISSKLYYSSKNLDNIILKDEIDELNNVSKQYYLSQDSVEGYIKGRLDKNAVGEIIKQDLDILKSDAFYICGPEEMILAIVETLKMFGVPKEKIHYELFTTPTILKSETPKEKIKFDGKSNVNVILDGETISLTIPSKGKTILETLVKEGHDAPYSCQGGVCCSCKAKVLKGNANMKLNYVLTDKEVENGYILTCQAHPASEDLTITFDE